MLHKDDDEAIDGEKGGVIMLDHGTEFIGFWGVANKSALEAEVALQEFLGQDLGLCCHFTRMAPQN